MKNYKYKTEPLDHQRKILDMTCDKEYWGYFLDPGLGKTKIWVDLSAYLFSIGEINGSVISTFKGMCPTLEKVEIPKHLPDGIPVKVYRYEAYKARLASDKDCWSRFLQFKGLKILVLNTDAAKSDLFTRKMREFYKVTKGRYLWTTDESSTIKTHTAARSKATVKFSRAAKYRRIMTGTPMTSGATEIFGQAIALGPPKDLLNHSSFTSFRGYYSVMEKKTFGNRSFNVVTGHKNLEELTETIENFSTIIKKEDVLDLPDKIYSKVVVELEKEQAKIYEKLKQEAIIELEELGETIEVTNILTLLVKLHQVACGQIKYDDGFCDEKYAEIPNNRLSTLMDILSVESEANNKVVIWSNYRLTLKAIAREIEKVYGKDSYVQFHGGTPNSEREVAASRFQDPDDPAKFFIANPQSAGMGLTLTESDIAVYYSSGYSLEQRIQSEDRIHRIGQTRAARYIDLICPGTVDERIVEALTKKKNLVDKVIVSKWREIIG